MERGNKWNKKGQEKGKEIFDTGRIYGRKIHETFVTGRNGRQSAKFLLQGEEGRKIHETFVTGGWEGVQKKNPRNICYGGGKEEKSTKLAQNNYSITKPCGEMSKYK